MVTAAFARHGHAGQRGVQLLTDSDEPVLQLARERLTPSSGPSKAPFLATGGYTELLLESCITQYNSV
jgi:hypothetical protein